MTGTINLGDDWQVVGSDGGDYTVEHTPSGNTYTLQSDGTFDAESVTTDHARSKHSQTTPFSVSGTGGLHGEQSFGRFPSNWTDEGVIFEDTNIGTEVVMPHIIKADDYLSNPIATYYLYYAPYKDKSSSDGIKLLTSDSIEDGWTSQGVVHALGDESIHADHISSPWVIWDEFNSQFEMYYHTKGLGPSGGQGTIRATSSDGETWAYQDKIIVPDDKPRRWDGEVNTYLRTYRFDGSYIGIYLGIRKGTSTDGAHIGLCWSHDGDTWVKSDTPLFNGDSPNFDPLNANLVRGSLLSINGTRYLLASHGTEEQMYAGPLTNLKSPPAMRQIDLPYEHYSYSPYYGRDKLYLVGATGTNNKKIRLMSKEWGAIA
jgi:hypothetical protein